MNLAREMHLPDYSAMYLPIAVRLSTDDCSATAFSDVKHMLM